MIISDVQYCKLDLLWDTLEQQVYQYFHNNNLWKYDTKHNYESSKCVLNSGTEIHYRISSLDYLKGDNHRIIKITKSNDTK